jgi:hypothetical protein
MAEGSEKIKAMDTPDEHMTFIRSQWPAFAAFAWEKYLAEGRGAIIVDLRNASTDGPRPGVPTFYVAEGSAGLRERGGWPSVEVAEVINDYDPEQDAVLIFLRLDGDAFHYNVSDDLTPPVAYKSKHKS